MSTSAAFFCVSLNFPFPFDERSAYSARIAEASTESTFPSLLVSPRAYSSAAFTTISNEDVPYILEPSLLAIVAVTVYVPALEVSTFDLSRVIRNFSGVTSRKSSSYVSVNTSSFISEKL